MRRKLPTFSLALAALALSAVPVAAQSPVLEAAPAPPPASMVEHETSDDYVPQFLPDVSADSYDSMPPSGMAGYGDDLPSVAGAAADCQTCSEDYRVTGARYPYDRCGCNLGKFPWIRGTGNCDTWCVGPHWDVQVGGLIMYRDNVNWAPVIAAVGAGASLVDPFDEGPGARVAVTGFNDSGFGLQVVYEGINDFTAATVFPLGGSTRAIDYSSRFNSVELNFMPRVAVPFKIFGGLRYFEMTDNFIDFTTVDKVIPAPADPPAASAPFIDTGTDYITKNRLLGFQIGGYRDSWELNRWLSVQGFANVGFFLNDIRREDITRNVTTVINGDDLATPDTNEFSQTVTEVNTIETRSFSEAALVGEAGLTGVVRLNPCVALYSGYQVLAVDGVTQGVDAFLTAGIVPDTLIYHGLQFGFEYRR